MLTKKFALGPVTLEFIRNQFTKEKSSNQKTQSNWPLTRLSCFAAPAQQVGVSTGYIPSDSLLSARIISESTENESTNGIIIESF